MNFNRRCKFWWKGEPMIVNSLRYRVVLNDIIQDVRAALAEYRKTFRVPNRKNLTAEQPR